MTVLHTHTWGIKKFALVVKKSKLSPSDCPIPKDAIVSAFDQTSPEIEQWAADESHLGFTG